MTAAAASKVFAGLTEGGDGELDANTFTRAFASGAIENSPNAKVKEELEIYKAGLRSYPKPKKGTPVKRANTTKCVPFKRSPGPSKASQNVPVSPLKKSYSDRGRSPSMHWKPVGGREHNTLKGLKEEYLAMIEDGGFRGRSGDANASPADVNRPIPGSPECQYAPDGEPRGYRGPRERERLAEEAVLAALGDGGEDDEEEEEEEQAPAVEEADQAEKEAQEAFEKEQAEAEAAAEEQKEAEERLEKAKESEDAEAILAAELEAAKAKRKAEKEQEEADAAKAKQEEAAAEAAAAAEEKQRQEKYEREAQEAEEAQAQAAEAQKRLEDARAADDEAAIQAAEKEAQDAQEKADKERVEAEEALKALEESVLNDDDEEKGEEKAEEKEEEKAEEKEEASGVTAEELLGLFDELDEDEATIVSKRDIIRKIKSDFADKNLHGLVEDLENLSELLIEREQYEEIISKHIGA